jgi:hypothetical protein
MEGSFSSVWHCGLRPCHTKTTCLHAINLSALRGSNFIKGGETCVCSPSSGERPSLSLHPGRAVYWCVSRVHIKFEAIPEDSDACKGVTTRVPRS